MGVVRSSGSLHLAFYSTIHMVDKIERSPKRNSTITGYSTPQPKSVLLLSKGIEKHKNCRRWSAPEKTTKFSPWNARKRKKENQKSQYPSSIYLRLDGINSSD